MIKFAAFLLVGLMLTLAVQAAPATSTLSWEPPTERVDGTPFAVEDILEYAVTYTVDGEPSDRAPFVVDFAATSAEIVLELTPRAMPYTVAFQIVVVDKQGRMSLPSDPVSKVFALDSTAAPGVPTSVKFTVLCGQGCTIEEIVQEQ
jgi:hypothetical protein